MLKLLFGSYQGSVLENEGGDGTLETKRRTTRMVVVSGDHTSLESESRKTRRKMLCSVSLLLYAERKLKRES